MKPREKVWLRFMRDYQPGMMPQPLHYTGDVREIDYVIAECLIDTGYAVLAPREGEGSEKAIGATG
jgi:hypothetical protein